MKWLFFGCFLGSQRSQQEQPHQPQQQNATGRASQPVNLQHGLVLTTTGAGQVTIDSPRSQVTTDAAAVIDNNSAVQDSESGVTGGPSSVPRAAVGQTSSEHQETPAPRLSLDCGVGIGPSPPALQSHVAFACSPNLSFSQLPGGLPLAFVAHASADPGSLDIGVESFPTSEGSSGALAIRGGAAAAALTGPPGDLTSAGSRHLVSRAFRGRASLDALLMLGALVRAADEAGLSMSGLGATPRLERIESGDLSPGEDGHPDRQLQPRLSRHTGPGMMGHVASSREDWCAGADPAADGARLASRPQRRGFRWSLNRAGSGGDGVSGGDGASGGTTAAAAASLALAFESNNSYSTAPGAVAPGVAAPSASAAAASSAMRLGQSSDPDEFTFSQPTIASSQRQSGETSRAHNSDMGFAGQPHGLPPPQPSQGFIAQGLTDSNQVLELFMRLVTNCSTIGDTDPTSGDRSSAGTTGTVRGSRTATGAVTALPPGHQSAQLQRSSSARPPLANGRRLAGTDGARGPAHAAVTAAAMGAPGAGAAAAAAAASGGLNPQNAGTSAPLMSFHGRLLAGGGGGGGARRNSWDTLAGSSGSAVAVAAAAAAALAVAGLLPGSTSSRATGPGAGAGGSNSGRTGSAGRCWPMGGVLQEDSGPTSMLLVGALSGGMSLGGNNSTTSLVRMPTGSGSVRDVLSRFQQQQHLALAEGGPAATSSSSWSAHTGLASLFDAHLTAALRRNGAVRTFKRAVCGAATLSRASSIGSQQTGNLGRQDTSLTLSSGVMVLQFGSTGGSSAASGVGGASQLGTAASAATAAATGVLVSSQGPLLRPRRATISSMSTIHSGPDGIASADGDGGEGRSSAQAAAGGSAAAAAASAAAITAVRRPANQVGKFSDGGAIEAQSHRALMQRQLRAFVERQHPQHSPQHLLHPHGLARLSAHQRHPARQPYQQPYPQLPLQQPADYSPSPERWQGAPREPPEDARDAFGGGGGSGAAATAAARASSCVPPMDGLQPGFGEPGRLSLLGLASAAAAPQSAARGGGGGTRASRRMLVPAAPNATATAVDTAPGTSLPRHSSPPLELAVRQSMAAGALTAGPAGEGWLHPQAPRDIGIGGGGGDRLAAGRVLSPGTELSASLDFSRYSWETDWGLGGLRFTERSDTLTLTAAGSSFSQVRQGAATSR